MSAAPNVVMPNDEILAALKSIYELPGDGIVKISGLDLPIGEAKLKALQGANNPPRACSSEELTWLVRIGTNYDEHGPYRLEALKAFVRGIGPDNVKPQHVELVMQHIVYSDMMSQNARDYVMTDLLPAIHNNSPAILQAFVPSLQFVGQQPLSTEAKGFIMKGEPMSRFQAVKFSPIMREASLNLLADMGGPMVASWRKLVVAAGTSPSG